MIPDHAKVSEANWNRFDWPWLGTILVVVVLAWSYAYSRWTAEAWQTPIGYGSDGWSILALAKAFGTGEAPLIVPKYPHSFGAPFVANWNDYITVEEPIFVWHGLLTAIFGLGLGANLAVLTATLLAAAAFYFAARQLRSDRIFAAVCAVLFALSRCAFARNLVHLPITYYWHIPLGLLVVWSCLDRREWSRRSILVALFVGVAHGVQSPYYTNLFLQLLALTTLALLIRRAPRRQILMPILIGAVTISAFLLMNFDSIVSRLTHGPNPLALERTYAGVELYALKPIELLLPVRHRSHWLSEFVSQTYVTRALFLGEYASSYLGIVSIIGLAALLWATAIAVIRKATPVPRHFYIIIWILGYSVVGGLNGLVGIFGLVVFRATDRFSIAIMALALLFIATTLTRLAREWSLTMRWALPIAMLLVGLWDQMPPSVTASAIGQIRNVVAADAEFARSMENSLPRGAMVFQLPVKAYPESGPIEKMGDYEHFRPYLFTHHLRYSYGAHKGRTLERWQKDAVALGVPGLISTIERSGFSAVMINKNGYADRAASILESFRAQGRGNVISESPDLICLSLNPVRNATLPPEFDHHWHDLEGTAQSNLRWSDGSASIILHDENQPAPATKHVRFQLVAGGERRIEISRAGGALFSRSFQAHDAPEVVDLDIRVEPGSTELRFITDRPGQLPGNGDPRKLAFAVRDFTIVE